MSSRKQRQCTCTTTHTPRRVVLTGGPGAGKTAILEMLGHMLCRHVNRVPESAAMLFLGGFPRRNELEYQRAVQRAIFAVQLELEGLAMLGNPALVLCDRGIVDGFAYWPGPEDYWSAVGMSRDAAFARYDTVIHLRTPEGGNGYGHQNPVRSETAEQANEIDRRIVTAWDGHPRRFFVEASTDFVEKAARAIALIDAEIPQCCRAAVRLDRALRTAHDGILQTAL